MGASGVSSGAARMRSGAERGAAVGVTSTAARRARRTGTVMTAAAAVLTLMTAHAAQAQTLYGTPEFGVSQHRGPAFGARAGLRVAGGLDIVAQGLVFAPDEEQTADPGVDVDRSLWHGSLNAIYVFDRSRALAPYVGVGVRYGRSTLAIVVDGVRARGINAGFFPNVLGGVQLPRIPGRPFVEYRGGGDGGWVLTGGGSWTLIGPR